MNDSTDYNYNDEIRKIFKSNSKVDWDSKNPFTRQENTLNAKDNLKEEATGFRKALQKIFSFFHG